MVPVTAEFQAESALHPAARGVLLEAFDQGWADPRKIHSESRQAAILLQEAKESIAEDLGLLPSEIHFLGEISLGFQLGILGLAHNANRTLYSGIDRQEVLAIVGQFPEAVHMKVGSAGEVALPQLDPGNLVIWQSINAETGLLRPSVEALSDFDGSLFVDNTTYPTSAKDLSGWTTGLWEATSWRGPAGLSIFGLKTGTKNWRNPFPHLDQRIAPSGFSLPLAIASAVALKAWKEDEKVNQNKIQELSREIRTFVAANIPDADLVPGHLPSLPSIISMSFLYVDAERLQSDLARAGFSVDSGSACTSINLESSHVLKEMGLLSQGNIRLRLHHDVNVESVRAFLPTLQRLVEEQRR